MKALFIFVCLLPAIAFGQLLKQGTWEGTLSAVGYVEGCCTHSVNKSDSVKFSGSFSGRFELRNTDPTQPNSNRAEQTVWNNTSSPNTSTRWYDFYTFIPAGGWASDVTEDLFFQFHDKSANCSASPTLAMETINGRYRVRTRYSTADYCTVSNRVERSPVDVGSMANDFGKWVRWTIYYLPSQTGTIEIYKDGILIYSLYNAPTTYAGSQFPYLKIGIYKWVWARSNDGGSTSTKRIIFFDALNIYGSATTKTDILGAPANVPPTVSAGPDQTLAAGATSTTLTGTATDSDGSISARKWWTVTGPNLPTIAAPTSASTGISGMVAGTYQFRHSATDNSGDSTTDDVVIVAPPAANTPPEINTTETNSIYPMTVTIRLSASITDNGSIANILWEQLSGPGATIVSPGSAVTNVTGVTDSDYLFRVTATDNAGASTSQEVSVIVRSHKTIKITRGKTLILK